MKGSRITDKLKVHGKESNHQSAKNVYVQLFACQEGGELHQSARRNVLSCIIKIIIYIATHGSFHRANKFRKQKM